MVSQNKITWNVIKYSKYIAVPKAVFCTPGDALAVRNTYNFVCISNLAEYIIHNP